MTRWSRAARTGRFSSQFCQEPARPWTKTIGCDRPAPSSTTLTRRPSISHPALVLAPVDVQPRRAAPGAVAVEPRVGRARRASRLPGRHRPSPSGYPADAHRDRHRLDAAPLLGPAVGRGPAPLRHRAALRGASSRGPSAACARSSCGSASRRRTPRRRSCAAEPYPDAVETVNRWHAEGHFIHITSHRAEHCHARDDATGSTRSGSPYDELYCSYDKIARCPRDRDRRADRRQPGQHRPRPRRAGSRRRRSATRGTRTSARRKTSSARRTGPSSAAGSTRSSAATAARRLSGRRPSTPPPRTDRRRACRDLLPAVEPDAHRSTTGAAPSASRASSTARSSTSSTTCGSAARSRASSTSRPTAARCVVSNHAGALPPDAAMIAKAIKEEHPRHRPLHITSSTSSRAIRASACCCRRSAACPPTRPTCTACWPTSGSSCSSSPRAARAARSSTRTATACAASVAAGSSRRRCAPARRSSRSRSSAPRRRRRSSPTSPLLKRLTGLIYFPITPTFPHFGLLGMLGYLPAKFRIRFLPPVRTDDVARPPEDRGRTRRSCRPSPTRSARRSRRTSSTWSPTARSVWF